MDVWLCLWDTELFGKTENLFKGWNELKSNVEIMYQYVFPIDICKQFLAIPNL